MPQLPPAPAGAGADYGVDSDDRTSSGCCGCSCAGLPDDAACGHLVAASILAVGVRRPVAVVAPELQVREVVRAAVGERDAVMHLEAAGSAAADAGAVALTDMVA